MQYSSKNNELWVYTNLDESQKGNIVQKENHILEMEPPNM